MQDRCAPQLASLELASKAIYAFESSPSSRLSKTRAHIGQNRVFSLPFEGPN